MAEFIFENQALKELADTIENEGKKLAKSLGYTLATSPKIKDIKVKTTTAEYSFDDGEYVRQTEDGRKTIGREYDVEYQIDGDRSITKRFDTAFLQNVSQTSSLIIDTDTSNDEYLFLDFATVTWTQSLNTNSTILGNGLQYTEYVSTNNMQISAEVILIGNFENFYEEGRSYVYRNNNSSKFKISDYTSTPFDKSLSELYLCMIEKRLIRLYNRTINALLDTEAYYIITSINQTDLLDKKNYIKFNITFQKLD